MLLTNPDYFPTATQRIIDAITHTRKCKCVVLVMGGSQEKHLPFLDVAKEFGYPIIAVEASGGLAREIADEYRNREDPEAEGPLAQLVDPYRGANIKIFNEGCKGTELNALLHCFMLSNPFDYDD